MLGSIFASLGSLVGKFFGGGILSSTGRFIGKWIGDNLEKDDHEFVEHYKIARVKDNLFPVSNVVGTAIPLIYGKGRVYGALIWSLSINEVPVNSSVSSNSRNITHIYNKVDFLYYCSFAIAIAEGPISSIERIWCNDEIIDLSGYKYRIYYGTEDQMPDELIRNSSINQEIPAFRGIAYIVFEDFPLMEFGNNIPKFNFEIIRRPRRTNSNGVLENKIKGLNIIPGSGEFVYDTIIQTKRSFYNGIEYKSVNINSNNRFAIADSIYSSDYMKNICPNVEWVAPVVCWFTDSLDIENAEIYPAVEFRETPNVEFSEKWKVANFSRSNAREISKNSIGSPNYGGTVNDASVIRYLQDLRGRGYKIMFYPMIFVDLPGKPWRGHMTGNPSSIDSFFNKNQGYNNFILHYAELCRGSVDAFIIGSELKKITSIKEGGIFPAVIELKKLAQRVKEILGPEVKVSYAADWSEYHHTDGGWYHLDELWASDDIDFVGIDNYMPVTDAKYNSPKIDEIKKGFNSGEGYDYYFHNGIKIPLPSTYAWKNIKWWWSNEHINPDGKKTNWKPKSKKIWFTEYGFPSIDKATNQPNVFYDPECVDGGAPKYSNSRTDFSIQRNGIYEFLSFWEKEEYVENMFLWCFDARPYPNWPHSKKWADWRLWEKGHWINGKLGEVLLSEVIKEVSERVNIKSDINFVGLDHNIHHISINRNMNGFEIINLLRSSYFFDLRDVSLNNITFVKRGIGDEIIIDSKDLMPIDNAPYKIEEISAYVKKQGINLRYNNFLEDYSIGFEFFSNERDLCMISKIYFPFNMCSTEARNLASLMMLQIDSEKSLLEIKLPEKYINIKPSDIINLEIDNSKFTARVIRVFYKKFTVLINAVIEENIMLNMPFVSYFMNIEEIDTGKIEYIEISNIDYISSQKGFYFINSSKISRPLKISTDGRFYEKISSVDGGGLCGVILSKNLPEILNHYLIDESSYFDVASSNFDLNIVYQDLKKFSSAIVINKICIFSGRIKKLSDGIYRISDLIFPKNILSSNFEIGSSVFSMAKHSKIDVSDEILGQELYYLSGNEYLKLPSC